MEVKSCSEDSSSNKCSIDNQEVHVNNQLVKHDESLTFAIRGLNLNKSVNTAFNPFSRSKNKKLILDNLNINVVKGRIYALLGPSGSGKTTCIKCLIGLLDIDSGKILIEDQLRNHKNKNFNINLRRLGFMPQDYCLFKELTITETLFFFGKLYCMTRNSIKQRESFLINLLDLPNKNSFVSQLSGGQLRRTSLAVSLLNHPNILMLDEPTVGMDPILRNKIWHYLIDLSKNNNTTIIITTHYIEEARKADYLGFMRQGRIIEENTPDSLMKKYNQNILEDVFYEICCKSKMNNRKTSTESNGNLENNVLGIGEINIDSNINRNSKNQNANSMLSGNTSFIENSKECFEDFLIKTEKSEKYSNGSACFKYIRNKCSFSSNRLIANLYKDLLKCIRNKKLLVINLLVPIIQITFFCYCIGQTPKDLPVGIFNEDDGFMGINLGADIFDHMSSQTLLKKKYFVFKDGYSELREGLIWTLFHIDKNFTYEMFQVVSSQSQFNHKYKSLIHIYSDNTNDQISLSIKNTFMESVKNISEKYLNLYSQKNETSYPIIFEKPVFGEEKPIFTYFMAPGIALSVIFFMSVASTASNFVYERREGLTERQSLAGVRTLELLFSQLLIYSILMFIQMIIIIGLLFGFLKLPLKGSLLLLIVLIFSQGFSGLCYGLCLASILYAEETVIQVTLASFYPILLMSGIIWPIEAQPWWLKNYISKFSPLTYASDAFRAILEKDWDLRHTVVLRGFVATYAWTFLFSICFLVMFSRRYRILN